jgi:small-conductance mechanosensitive channel
MAFSVIGAFALIFGANILAEVAINVTLINAFAGILLMISALIINGLIEIGIESRFAKRLNIFRLYGRRIESRLATLVNLGAIIFWFFTMLGVMRINLIVRDSISAFLTDEVSIGSASFTLAGILTFFLVIWLSIVIANIIRAILEEDVLNQMRLAKGLPHTISVMVRYTLITIGLLLAVSAAGMPLDSLTILFGAFGVGIGFGLQNIFNNLVSGLILLFERPIQIGDTIEVGQLMGNVKSIGIRSSNVRTFDGAEVIVPNGLLISNEVVNWTLSDQTRRIEVIAGVAYGSDPHKVKELFEHVLSDHPDIIKEPPPKVFFQELGDSSLNFRLLFWTSNFSEWIRIRSDIIFGVHDILKKEGIEIPFPQRDLHIRSIEQQVEIASKGGKESKKGK